MKQALTVMAWFLVAIWMVMALMTMFVIVVRALDGDPLGDAVESLGMGMLILTVAVLVLFRLVGRFEGRCARRPSGGDSVDYDEARFLQDFHASLVRMEQRIEALETLLLDRGPRIPSGRP